MFRKAIIAVIVLGAVGFFGSKRYEKAQHRTKVHEIENSLFPMAVRLGAIENAKCQPTLIDMSADRVTLVCESLTTDQAAGKESLREALKEGMRQWASERPYKDHYLEVIFLDEQSLEAKK